MSDIPNDLITLSEAADYFGRHPNTFRNYNKKGLLSFYRDQSRPNNPIQISTAEAQRALGRSELEFRRGQQVHHRSTPQNPAVVSSQDETLRMIIETKDQLINMLQQQVAEYRQEVRELKIRRSELEAKMDKLQDKLANSPVALLESDFTAEVPLPSFPRWDENN
tara:strand:+ start:1100 stop:1594 length:495 start_codon:yes stop_codon:yes gene_type:complete